MNRNRKILIGAGGGAALIAAAAALAVAAPDRPRGHMEADLNRDGQVAATEIQQSARQRFAVFDVNGDGRLVGAELALMHEGGRDGRGRGGRGARLAPPATAADAPQQAAPAAGQPIAAAQPPVRHDFDGDGDLSLAEFQRGIATRYMLLDSNGDGNVSAEEMQAAPRGMRRGGRGGGDR